MQNGSECARIAVQAIADQLGINIRENIVAIVAQDAEYRIQEFIKPAVILHKQTHTPKLTVQHVNMVLESIKVSPLLGYSSALQYNTNTIVTEDNDELCIVEDKEVDLAEAAKKINRPAPRPVPFYFQWMMVNGNPIDRRSPPINRLPFQSPADSLYHHSINDSIETQQKTNRDVISPDLQDYFEHAIELFDSNDCEQQESVFLSLSTDAGIQPLLPLFLQFFSYKLMTDLNDNDALQRVCNYLYRLIDNQSLPIHLFAHPILRIIMTIILKYNFGSSDDKALDVTLRSTCSEIIDRLCSRCISGFPNIRTVIANAMIQALFNPKTTLPAHYGALLAIQHLGKDVIIKIAPHIPFYINCLKRELIVPKNTDERALQAELMKNVLIQLEILINLIKDYELQPTSKYQAALDTIGELNSMIDSVVLI